MFEGTINKGHGFWNMRLIESGSILCFYRVTKEPIPCLAIRRENDYMMIFKKDYDTDFVVGNGHGEKFDDLSVVISLDYLYKNNTLWLFTQYSCEPLHFFVMDNFENLYNMTISSDAYIMSIQFSKSNEEFSDNYSDMINIADDIAKNKLLKLLRVDYRKNSVVLENSEYVDILLDELVKTNVYPKTKNINNTVEIIFSFEGLL